MEVLILNPHGYCLGVNEAIATALKAKKDHPDKNVYLLGLLVHNEETVDLLQEHGLIPLDERKASLLDYLFDMKKGDVVVFSAHGHPDAYTDFARDKGLIIVDATCRYVKENLDLALSLETPICYVGVEGHLESEAFLANSPEAVFYDVKSDTCNFLKLKGMKVTPTVITQTTLSSFEVERAMNNIHEFFPDAKIAKQRCHSTTLRQQAILDLPEDVDCVIVLGSNRSNNSVKLAEIAASKGKETHLCLTLEDVKALDLSQKKRLALSSGASTSNATFDAVLNYLRSL